MSCRGLRSPRLYAWAAALLAACIAATLAHMAIDAIGDYVLPHDAYDDVAHGSRSLTAALATLTALVLGALALASALVERRTGRIQVRELLERTTGPGLACFAAVVATVTIPLMMTMEALDLVLQNGRIEDATDLLGGSVALALAVTVPIAAGVALSVRALLAALLGSCRALVDAAYSTFMRRVHGTLSTSSDVRRRRASRLSVRTALLASNANRRGPPGTVRALSIA